MKKLLIGSLVGGILLFIWQTLSWTVLDLHGKEYQKAPNETELLSTISSNFTEDGQYYLPRLENSASSADMKKKMEDMKGKPWAVVSFHKAYDANMVSNVIRSLIVGLLTAFFACWVLSKSANSTFGSTFTGTLLIGLTGYLFIPYSGHVWFQTPGAMTNLVDTLVAWGLCGLWLGYWLNRKK